MTDNFNIARGAMQKNCAWKRTKARFNSLFRHPAVFFMPLVVLGFIAQPAQAELRMPANTPLQQFGFGTGPEVNTIAESNRHLSVMEQILGQGAVMRTGLGWDPVNQNVPGFKTWSENILEPALAKGMIVLPNIKTLNLGSGLRLPTDTQWTTGLREIVRMYGPGGTYQRGGSYVFKGRTVSVAPHPGFQGLTDYELWNEPNTQGNLGGLLTPSRMANLLKIGSAAMRDEAAKLGFSINIVGPAIGGANLDYLTQLWQADNNLFDYIDTLSFHIYMKVKPSNCEPLGRSKLYCIKTLALIRDFMDTHGGANVHLAMTEGGYTGDLGTCLGPQVLTEQQQADYNEEAMVWLRANAHIDYDFWITIRPIDEVASYKYACDSRTYDRDYWNNKHGVLRPDMTLKAWGVRYRELVNAWKP